VVTAAGPDRIVSRPEVASEAQLPEKSASPRLHFLDGLRGLAALYVVIGHCYLDVLFELSEPARHGHFWSMTKVLSWSFVSVALFIVLSGFCLTLPIVKSADLRLAGGALQYFKRRARRILPGYYGALFLSIALISAAPCLRVHRGLWGWCLPDLQFDKIAAHILLIHNLHFSWSHSIGYPLWSVATEWQIYFLFPLLLLPVWRRFGIGCSIICAYVLGYLPHILLLGRFDTASPWFLGLFATGMCAAAINFSNEPSMVRLRATLPWGTLSLLTIGLTLMFAAFPRLMFDPVKTAIYDPLFGTATGCALVYFTKLKTAKHRTIMLSFLESKPLQVLGSFS